MIWVDREVKKLKERNLPLEWVDDMKTPSGRIHVGSLRGVLVHDLMYKAMKQAGIHTRFSYVFNDMDPMDAIPSYLDHQVWKQYAGKPLYKIPSPEEGYESFADYYAKEFISVFNTINCHPEIIWSHKLYDSGKMNAVIKLFLDNAETVRKIYKEVAKAERKPNWIPFNPICEKCGNIGTTDAYKWDGTYVYYHCRPDMVDWATGCGHEGKISPFDGRGKLPWKLDWPAHWKIIGVTIESSGKDHMSSGGSYDMAAHFCRNILKTLPPAALGGYEWFTIGGRKMSSSKGIGTSAKEVTQILPPGVFRFFMVRTPMTTHLDFNPYGETIPNLFDDYDRCLNAYYDKLENTIPKGKQGEVLLDFARIIELSEVNPYSKKRMFLPRFRTIANIINTGRDAKKHFEAQLKRPLNEDEISLLNERVKYAKKYLEKYASSNKIASETAPSTMTLTEKQRDFLNMLSQSLAKTKNAERESVQTLFFELIKKSGLKPHDAFCVFYQTLTGNSHGPKAADLILKLSIPTVISSIESVVSRQTKHNIERQNRFPTLTDGNIFSIHPNVQKQFPSITVGVAIIKNISISKESPELNAETDAFLKTQDQLTNDLINSYPEVRSYRMLYKQMSVDWHSRRPSPEALLRRIALKKGLYKVNACVDAYNLIVMRRRVSVGAFDLDKIVFPTLLRFPTSQDKILLLGDKEPTSYKPTELAYFDGNGGYNIDFNYRDAVRTKVSEKTKNILINIDGVFDISRSQVEQSLDETITVIKKYCGGSVELAAIAEAKV